MHLVGGVAVRPEATGLRSASTLAWRPTTAVVGRVYGVGVAEHRKVVMKPLTWALIALAVVFVAVAVVYFTKSAADLPSFFPGHDAGSTTTHTKHGLAMLGLAVVSLAGAWMTTAPGKHQTD